MFIILFWALLIWFVLANFEAIASVFIALAGLAALMCIASCCLFMVWLLAH